MLKSTTKVAFQPSLSFCEITHTVLVFQPRETPVTTKKSKKRMIKELHEAGTFLFLFYSIFFSFQISNIILEKPSRKTNKENSNIDSEVETTEIKSNSKAHNISKPLSVWHPILFPFSSSFHHSIRFHANIK